MRISPIENGFYEYKKMAGDSYRVGTVVPDERVDFNKKDQQDKNNKKKKQQQNKKNGFENIPVGQNPVDVTFDVKV